MTDIKTKPSSGKPARAKKVAYAGKEPDSDFHLEILNITLPNEEKMKQFQVERNLTEEQTKTLCRLLHHVHQDLEIFNAHYSKIESRKEQIKAFIEVEDKVFQLKEVLAKHLGILDQVLPLDVMERIGEAFDLSLARQAIDDSTSYRRLNADIDRRMRASSKIDADAIAAMSLPRRQAIGLNHGHLLLKYFIDRIHRPLGVWVAINGDNKGGRPRKYAREYLMFWLVYESEALTGKKAPRSKKGVFVDFCRAVVELCDLPSQGADAALPKIVLEVAAFKDRLQNHD